MFIVVVVLVVVAEHHQKLPQSHSFVMALSVEQNIYACLIEQVAHLNIFLGPGLVLMLLGENEVVKNWLIPVHIVFVHFFYLPTHTSG